MSDLHAPTSKVADEVETLRGRVADLEREGEAKDQSKSKVDASEQQLRLHNRALVRLSRSQAVAMGDLEASLREITHAAADALCVERVSVWLYSDDRTQIRCQLLYERSHDRYSEGVELTAASYPVYFQAIGEDRTIAAHDACGDERTREFAEPYLRPLSITSMLDAPMRMGGQLVGIICHEHVGPMRRWSVEEQAFAGSMADLIIIAMQAATRRQAQEAALESERRLRQIIDLVPHMIFVRNSRGEFLLANKATADAYGVEVDQLIGKRHASIHPVPAEAAAMSADDAEVIQTRRPKSIESQSFTDAAGNERLLQIVKIPFHDRSAKGDSVLSVATDITDLKRAQQQQAFMIQELDHRVKNNLAKVLSVAELTMMVATSIEEFNEAFSGRIRSMAIAHEMLARSGWAGAELRDMVMRVVEPFARDDGQRVTVSGGRIVLSPSIAPPVCMILHELATNAAKYGSLSTPFGRLAVEWSLHDEPGQRKRLHLQWKEQGGPEVSIPERRGFGTEFIDKTASFQLHGHANMQFDPSGFRCELDLPVDMSAETGDQPENCAEIPDRSVPAHIEDSRLHGLRVLLVEDDYLVAKSLAENLRALGCEVVGPVSNAQEGRRLAREGNVDAAILDVNLTPGTSAPVARALNYRDCPFVFITGYSNLRVLPDDLQGHRVLCKPVDRQALAEALGEMVAR